MSDKERPRADDGRDGADEEDEEGRPTEPMEPKDKKYCVCGDKGKKASLFRLRKGKKLLLHRERKQRGVSVNSECWWRRLGTGSGGGWCCLCLKATRTLGSSGELPTGDASSSEFNFDMLRALIEKNDFYSKECNPHMNSDG